MRHSRLHWTLFTLSFAICISSSICKLSGADTTTPVRVLAISDIHFNPYFGLSNAEFSTLAALDADQWEGFFAKRSYDFVGSWPRDIDTNFRLLTSALDAAANELPNPAFIVYPGDFLCHEWKQNYVSLTSPSSISDDPLAFKDFTSKCLQFVIGQMRKRFPKTVILPTPGNDDSMCEDYWFQQSGEFASILAKEWQPLVGGAVDKSQFVTTVSELGSFSAELPGLPSHRLISMNSVFLSHDYCTQNHDPQKTGDCCNCVDLGVAPGDDLLKWLDNELQNASKAGKKVWLLMHVPPGLDSYAEDKQGKKAAGHQWRSVSGPGDFLARYLALLARKPGLVQASFAGHTHMDDFRIDRAPSRTPLLLHKIVPSVSPINGNNPAFQIFDCDPATGEWIDYHTFYLPIKLTSPSWSKEYTASEAYDLKAIDASSVATLFGTMHANPTGKYATLYAGFYNVDASVIKSEHIMVYLCAVLHARYTEYAACYSKASGSVAPPLAGNIDLLRRQAVGMSD